MPIRDDTVNVDASTVIRSATGAVSSGRFSYPIQAKEKLDGYDTHFQLDRSSALQLNELRRRGIPRILGHLGELLPVSGTTNRAWVFDQIRDYPLAFAQQAETVFIHRTLYHNAFPRPLRAAFGICAGCFSRNERNRSLLFQALDTEMSELLTPGLTSPLIEDLARLQAIVLYQIIRLFYGSLEERIIAERQEFLVRSYALSLLQRVDAELRNVQRGWETWILAESIRRTVFIAFKLYTVYSTLKNNVCAEIAAMNMLPVSTILGSWNSRDAYLQHLNQDETMTYSEFISLSAMAPRRENEPFEKLLLVGCKSIDQFNVLIGQESVVDSVSRDYM